MALLVASLLLAALAPVMTRRMSTPEIKVMSEAADYDKDMVVSIFTRDTNFNIPSDANQVRVTMMGGGGKGGDANWGSMVVTNSQAVTLPEGVDKIRVFMVGGGGGGASGGVGVGTAYENTPEVKQAEITIEKKTPGEYNLVDLISEATLSSGDTKYVAPALFQPCIDSGVAKWTIKEDGTQIAPGAKFTKLYSTPTSPTGNIKFTNLYACGGGGGGGGTYSVSTSSTYLSGGGGSGGYTTNKTLTTATLASNIYIKIGGGGGGGGAKSNGLNGGYGGGGGGGGVYEAAFSGANGGLYGGKGGNGLYANTGTAGSGLNGTGTTLAGGGGRGNCGSSYQAGSGGNGAIWGGGGGGGAVRTNTNYTGGGGGGGGPTTISTKSGTSGTILFQVGGGGGGGGASTNAGNSGGGGGGGGGGYGGGGGGGGSSCSNGSISNGGSGGKLLDSLIGLGTGKNGGNGDNSNHLAGGGGGGYGGSSGNGASAGTISTVFDLSNCNGGTSGTTAGASGNNGLPGAIKFNISADIPAVENALYCDYNQPANGGGGGGGGEVTVGEVSINASNRTIYLEVGAGGNGGTTAGSNGSDGGKTAIYVGSNNTGTELISARGGLAGGYSSASTTVGGAGGAGQGSSIKGTNWIKESFTGGQSGTNGYAADSEGTTTTTGGHGGIGGNSQFYDVVNKQVITVYGGYNGGSPDKTGKSPNQNTLNTNNIYYGAGGGGGAGAKSIGDNAGLGGDGGNGYIYIEWGGSNGGGGTVGEFVQTTITNLDPDPTKREMKIRIGRGGGITGIQEGDDTDLFTSSTIGSNGDGGTTSISISSGGKTVTHRARGGAKGDNGHTDVGDHGVETAFPSGYSEFYKEYVQGNMNIILGQAAPESGEYGGMGGYLACVYTSKDEQGNKTCAASAPSNDGSAITAGPVRPGCGGSAIPSPLYEPICNAFSIIGNPNGGNGVFGGGGGGGAVLNSTGGKGGNGGNGFVILEYKSTRLE